MRQVYRWDSIPLWYIPHVCLPLENLKDKQLKMNIKLLIIKHKKGKEKGQEKGPNDQKRSLMDSGATLFVPQGNPKCEARV
jgi:hypothetical protein